MTGCELTNGGAARRPRPADDAPQWERTLAFRVRVHDVIVAGDRLLGRGVSVHHEPSRLAVVDAIGVALTAGVSEADVDAALARLGASSLSDQSSGDGLPWEKESEAYRAQLDQLFAALTARGVDGATCAELAAELGWTGTATRGKLRMLRDGGVAHLDDGRWSR